MSRPDSEQQPSFLWQGLLILLPVAALAVVGLSAITRDRAAVQEDARRRAHEILAQISDGLGRSAAERLTAGDSLAQKWLEVRETDVVTWPGYGSFPSTRAEDRPQFEIRLKEWQAAFPHLKPEDAFPFKFLYNNNGTVRWPPDYEAAPQPPAWLLQFSPEQSEAWAALEQSEHDPSRAGDFDGLVVRFLATHPPPEAQAAAAFLRLRRENASQPSGEAITNLFDFSRRVGSTPGQSGISLSDLALAEALNRGLATKPVMNPLLWHWTVDQMLHRPSGMTPQLLERLENLSVTNTPLAAAAGDLRQLWNAEERLRETVRLIDDHGKAKGLPIINLWIESEHGSWLCLLNNGWPVPSGSYPTKGLITNDFVFEARAYPRQIVERAFATAVGNSQIGVPDYFGLFAELEGEPLNLNPRDQSAPTVVPAGDEVLAEVTGVLSQPATLVVEKGTNGQSLKTTELESLPSKPRFALRLALTDKNLLFAHQRQRQFIFGSVIGLSAVAAIIGFIAARRAFRRQLRLNELKSNFVSSVSHELRAPIASVRLMAESLERGKVSERSKQHEYFGFIVQECRRLSALIENVLDFSRIEQGRKQYELEPTDLAALAGQTVKLMETYAAERKVELRFTPDADPLSRNRCHVNVDGRAIQQALVNLIDNAIKHSPAGEKVTVGLETKNGASASAPGESARARLSVEDRGAGIPASEHERIFERFYRSGSELRRQTQGVGIGLSIVKHIIEAHGGRIMVRSAPGEGSRFTIELPLRSEQKTNRI